MLETLMIPQFWKVAGQKLPFGGRLASKLTVFCSKSMPHCTLDRSKSRQWNLGVVTFNMYKFEAQIQYLLGRVPWKYAESEQNSHEKCHILVRQSVPKFSYKFRCNYILLFKSICAFILCIYMGWSRIEVGPRLDQRLDLATGWAKIHTIARIQTRPKQ